jgi:hypothetical protein
VAIRAPGTPLLSRLCSELVDRGEGGQARSMKFVILVAVIVAVLVYLRRNA